MAEAFRNEPANAIEIGSNSKAEAPTINRCCAALGAVLAEALCPVLPYAFFHSPRMIRRSDRTLDDGDLGLSPLGYGGGTLFGVPEEREAADLLGYAYERGFRYFDTAPLYATGLAEHWFGAALRQRPRESFVLSTKVGRRLRAQPDTAIPSDRLQFEVFYDYSYDGVLRAFEDSLQRLGLARIDIALLHDVNPRHQGERYEQRFSEAMEGAYRALERLRAESVVRAIGVGLKGWDVCLRFARAGDFDCMMLAGGYTLLEHESAAEFLPYCAAHDIAVIVASPFNSGILATGVTDRATFFYSTAPRDVMERTARIEAICREHRVPLGAAALQFTLGHRAVVSAVCGYRSRDQVDTNLRWTALSIPPALWDDLKTAKLVADYAPAPDIAR